MDQKDADPLVTNFRLDTGPKQREAVLATTWSCVS